MARVWSGYLKMKVVTALRNHKRKQNTVFQLPDFFIVTTINAYTSHQEACGEKWQIKTKELIFEFFKPYIPYKFLIWEYIHNTNSVYLPKMQK